MRKRRVETQLKGWSVWSTENIHWLSQTKNFDGMTERARKVWILFAANMFDHSIWKGCLTFGPKIIYTVFLLTKWYDFRVTFEANIIFLWLLGLSLKLALSLIPNHLYSVRKEYKFWQNWILSQKPGLDVGTIELSNDKRNHQLKFENRDVNKV